MQVFQTVNSQMAWGWTVSTTRWGLCSPKASRRTGCWRSKMLYHSPQSNSTSTFLGMPGTLSSASVTLPLGLHDINDGHWAWAWAWAWAWTWASAMAHWWRAASARPPCLDQSTTVLCRHVTIAAAGRVLPVRRW